jgi:DNA (cytosine-5)-methyltransferase 1
MEEQSVSRLRVLDLFSGIGGFSLGLERTGGFETVAFCEIEAFPRKVLAKHWPNVPCYDDVRTLTAERLAADGIRGIDVITGGFPCQDLSSAGKRAGLNGGTRSGLYAEVLRLACDIRPRFIILENVAGLLSGPSEQRGGWFGTVLGDLAAIGYDAEWENIPASALGAPHRRERIWLMAYPSKNDDAQFESIYCGRENRFLGDRSFSFAWWEAEPDVGRVADGVPDRAHRLAGCGNAVVPQIPELIGNAILEAMGRNP